MTRNLESRRGKGLASKTYSKSESTTLKPGSIPIPARNGLRYNKTAGFCVLQAPEVQQKTRDAKSLVL